MTAQLTIDPMRVHTRRLSWAMTFAAGFLNGCDKSPTAPEVFDPMGSLSFAYSGALTGTYEAKGQMDVTSGVVPQAVTGATAYRQDSLLTLLAFRTSTVTGVGDAFTLALGASPPVGSQLSLDPLSCQQSTLANCRVGIFLPSVTAADLQGSADLTAFLQRSYVLVLGNIVVTSRTALRIKGTFQGIAFRANEQSLTNILNISAGQFDLPIRPQATPP